MIDKFFLKLFGSLDCFFEWLDKKTKPNKNCKCSICTCKGK